MQPIRINLMRTNHLALPVLIAQQEKIFKKNDVLVEINLQKTLYEQKDAFFNGDVDAMIGDLTRLLSFIDQGKKVKITSTLTRTLKIVANKKFDKLEELNNLKIGVNAYQSLGLYLEEFINQYQLNLKVIDYQDAYLRLDDMLNKKIDMLIAIEPFASKIVNQGGQIVYSGLESDHYYIMWAFREAYYNQNKEHVKRFHQSLNEANKFFNNLSQPQKIKAFIKYANFDQKQASQVNDLIFEQDIKFEEQDFERCQKWLKRKQKLDKLYDPKEYIVDVFE